MSPDPKTKVNEWVYDMSGLSTSDEYEISLKDIELSELKKLKIWLDVETKSYGGYKHIPHRLKRTRRNVTKLINEIRKHNPQPLSFLK